jgi:hypothetical protein
MADQGQPGVARIVVCAPTKLPGFFRDDLHGTCALCRQPVRFRPHVPTVRILVCLECFLVHAEPGANCELMDEAQQELAAIGVELPIS